MPIDTPDYSDGVAIMLQVPDDVAQECALEGGTPPDGMHVTLVYFGSVDELQGMDSDQFFEYANQLCQSTPPIPVDFNGLTRFSSSEDADPLVINADAPALETMRRQAVDTAPSAPKATHGYTPHMTIAYLDKGEPLPFDTWTTKQGTITHATAAYGPDERTIPLADQTSAAAVVDAPDAETVIEDTVPTVEDSASVFPNGKVTPASGDQLALLIDNSDGSTVLELAFTDETGLYLRDADTHEWVPVSADAPEVQNVEWVGVVPEAVDAYDSQRPNSDSLSKDDFSTYTLSEAATDD